MVKSGYVLAGFETLASIIDNFMKGKKGRFNDNFKREDVSRLFSSISSGFLHSFGQNFSNKKRYDKYKKSEASVYTKCREMNVFGDCPLIADSGGFQISIGRLSRKESDVLYRLYYEWIEEYHEVFDKAFILDIPPGPGCKIFENFDDVYNLNLESYLRAKNLPDEIRKKIIYIHHFRTPSLWNIYTKILREYEMFDFFDYHGTGGIVANMSSDMSIPCIIYVLPLIPLLNECKKYNRKFLNFHVLGGANFRDILFYELFQIVVKNEHDIDLNITYDSSGIYKQVMTARFLHIKDIDGNVKKLNIKRDNLRKRLNGSYSVYDSYQRILDETADRWGFKRISLDGVYDDNTGTFFEDVKVYSMMYTLELFAVVQEEMRSYAKHAYKVYSSGDMDLFYRDCLEATKILNQGNLTRKQKTKAHSIPRSLDMLVKLDEDYCKYLVDKVLSKDEFTELDYRKRVPAFV